MFVFSKRFSQPRLTSTVKAWLYSSGHNNVALTDFSEEQMVVAWWCTGQFCCFIVIVLLVWTRQPAGAVLCRACVLQFPPKDVHAYWWFCIGCRCEGDICVGLSSSHSHFYFGLVHVLPRSSKCWAGSLSVCRRCSLWASSVESNCVSLWL